jgi:hypothetical protein
MRRDDSAILNTYIQGQGSAGTNWSASEKSYLKALTEAMKNAAKTTAERVAALSRQAPMVARSNDESEKRPWR